MDNNDKKDALYPGYVLTGTGAAAPDVGGLTRYTGAEIAGIYTYESENFFLAEDVERLLATKAAAQAVPQQAVPEGVRIVGAKMANTMFNLAQREGQPLDADLCSSLKDMQKEWDAVVRAVPPVPAPADLTTEVERLKAAKANLIQQARMWRYEARAQRATVLGILRRFGLPEHDWEAKRLIVHHVQRLTQSSVPDEQPSTPVPRKGGITCNKCGGKGYNFTGVIGEPPEECEACFDQQPDDLAHVARQPAAATAEIAMPQGAGKFTKKPVTIEAIQWSGSNLAQIIEFTDGRKPDVKSDFAAMKWEEYAERVKRDGLKIFTLEGKMNADIGDLIIRGIKGELYPCKPEIFAMTYSPAIAGGSVRGAICVALADQADRANDNAVEFLRDRAKEGTALEQIAERVLAALPEARQPQAAPSPAAAQEGEQGSVQTVVRAWLDLETASREAIRAYNEAVRESDKYIWPGTDINAEFQVMSDAKNKAFHAMHAMYDALIAAPSSSAQAAPADLRDAARDALVQALQDIVDPISAMKRAVPEGCTLNPHIAIQMANEPEWYKRHAQDALDALRSTSTATEGSVE